MEKIWYKSFYKDMLINISETPLFITHNHLFDSDCRKKMSKIFFENFNVPNLYFGLSNVTGLYADGKTTGVVIDSSYSNTNCLKIFEGYPIED